MDQRHRGHVVTLLTTTLVFIVAALVALVYREPAHAPAKPRLFNRHAVATMLPHQKGESTRRDADGAGGPEQEQYENRAFPGMHISVDRREQAEHAFESVSGREHGKWHAWEEVGPTTPLVAGEATYTGRATTDSGRVTALALSARCRDDECILLVGAAGGGVWRTGNALAAKPAAASGRTQSDQLLSIRRIRPAGRCTSGLASRMGQATLKPVSVCTDRTTAADRGRSCRAASRRRQAGRLALSRSIRRIEIIS
jgi:hypothetical protein